MYLHVVTPNGAKAPAGRSRGGGWGGGETMGIFSEREGEA